MRIPAPTVVSHSLRMGIKSENIVATAVTLLTASERSVAAVTDAYRARLEDYLASML